MRIIGIVVAILAIITAGGLADAKVKIKKACGTEIEKFCKDVKKGEGRKACLRSHAAELQPRCSDALKERDAEKAAKTQR